jgi:hypothetical protein
MSELLVKRRFGHFFMMMKFQLIKTEWLRNFFQFCFSNIYMEYQAGNNFDTAPNIYFNIKKKLAYFLLFKD